MTRIERATKDLDVIKFDKRGILGERSVQGQKIWENDKIGMQIQINQMTNKNEALKNNIEKKTMEHA